MDTEEAARTTDRATAIFLARAILGIVFCVAGLYKTFMWGPVAHARELFVIPYATTFLPVWSLWLTGVVVPPVEFVAGGLVLIGLWTRPALAALAGVLVMVTFGHLLVQPTSSIFMFIMPRSALLLVVLLSPPQADRYAVSSLLGRTRRAQRTVAAA
jgi:putative oxidoreductase